MTENATQTRTITLLYFAWVREMTGKPQETVSLPTDIKTIADLAQWLKNRGNGYQSAFQRPQTIRAAIDKKHVTPETEIGAAREIAFFPPVTGG